MGHACLLAEVPGDRARPPAEAVRRDADQRDSASRSLPLPGRCIPRLRHRPRRRPRPPLSRANRSRGPTPPRTQRLSAEGRATPSASAADAGPCPPRALHTTEVEVLPRQCREARAAARYPDCRRASNHTSCPDAMYRWLSSKSSFRAVASSHPPMRRSSIGTKGTHPHMLGAGRRPSIGDSGRTPDVSRLRWALASPTSSGRSDPRRRNLGTADLADLGTSPASTSDARADVVRLDTAACIDAHDDLALRASAARRSGRRTCGAEGSSRHGSP